MKWTAVKRNYHGEEAAAMVRWIVGVEGETCGICECWEEEAAKGIAAALNCYEAMGFSPIGRQPLDGSDGSDKSRGGAF